MLSVTSCGIHEWFGVDELLVRLFDRRDWQRVLKKVPIHGGEPRERLSNSSRANEAKMK